VPEFSGVDTGFIENACKVWNVPKLPAFAFDDSVEYDTPALLVFGALAPEVSTTWSSILAASMPNATSVIFPTLDGNVVNQGGPRCFADLRRAFLANPSASLPVAACEAQSPPIHFVAG